MDKYKTTSDEIISILNSKTALTTIQRLELLLDDPINDPIRVLQEIKWVRELHKQVTKFLNENEGFDASEDNPKDRCIHLLKDMIEAGY